MDGTTELRLVGVSEDGQRLVFTDSTGTERTVAIDDRLRAAVNGHLSRLGQLTMALESRISPKEIQTRVRAGESAEHVALTAGVPLERVLRFVGPVLREREHVAEQARRARLIVPGRTPTTGPASLLGDLVQRICHRRGVDATDVSWDSARRDDQTWLITVSWPGGAVASWAFDPLRHQVSPLDAASRRISGLPSDPEADASGTVADDADLDLLDEPAEPVSSANVHAFGRRPRAVPEPPAATELTLDDPAAAEPAVDGEQPDGPNDSVEADPAPEPTSTRPGARPSKRASVPNWDDIVFGMKPKE